MADRPIKAKIMCFEKQMVVELSYRANHHQEKGQFEDSEWVYFQEYLNQYYKKQHELLLNSNSNTCRAVLRILA